MPENLALHDSFVRFCGLISTTLAFCFSPPALAIPELFIQMQGLFSLLCGVQLISPHAAEPVFNGDHQFFHAPVFGAVEAPRSV
jgi:hypothetical protein